MAEENVQNKDSQSTKHPSKPEQKKIDKAKKNLLQTEAQEKDWKFSNFVLAIALILPPAFWFWPRIRDSWIPDAQNITIISAIVVLMAILAKLRRTFRDLQASSDVDIISGKKLSAERESISLSVNFEGKGLGSKPLTKSMSMKASEYGKGNYRHEGLLGKDKDSLLSSHPITNWGGGESKCASGPSGSNSAKKAPKR